MSDQHKIQVTAEISFKSLAEMLVTAFEGGSNYWIDVVELVAPIKIDFQYDETETCKIYTYPFNEGGAVEIFCEGCKKPHRLDLDAIKRGAALFIKTHHYGDFISEQWDATTADVFLQLCLFGDIVYA